MNPLSDITPSYLYAQYQDDETLQAFIDSYNSMTQGYLDWFNNTPLAIYTFPTVTGSLLDWTGRNLYHVTRPAISTYSASYFGALITVPTITRATSTSVYTSSGSSTLVSDDVYKRVITWFQYKGDGMQSSLTWLRRRVARFLYGTNGADCDASDYLLVNIDYSYTGPTVYHGATNTQPTNVYGTNVLTETNSASTNPVTIINLPSTAIGNALYNLFSQGVFPVPFQANIQVQVV